MVAVFRSSTANGSTGIHALNLPAGAVAGDLLIVGAYSNVSPGFLYGTHNQTFTTIANVVSGSNLVLSWAIYTGNIGSGMNVTGSGAAASFCLCFVKDTFDPVTPIEASVSTAIVAAATSMAIGTITTTIDGCLLVVGAGINNDNNAGGNPLSVPTGYTQRAGFATSSGTDCSIIAGTLAQASAGTTAAANITQPAAYGAMRSVLCAIRPLVRSASIAGAMTGIDGTVHAAASSGASTSGQIIGTMSGLDGGATVRAFREDFVRPRREFVWVYNYEGEQVHVLS